MSDYAVVNPATGETVKEYGTISDEDLRGAIGRADAASREWASLQEMAASAGTIVRLAEAWTDNNRR